MRSSISAWFQRLKAWASSKQKLHDEVKGLERRLWAMMVAKDEALAKALVLENEDVARWLQEVARSDKAALGARLKKARDQVRDLEARLKPLAASEARAWKTADAVIEAWENAAQIRTATWDAEAEAWVPVFGEAVLPQDVVRPLKAWVAKQKTPPKDRNGVER